MANLSMRSASTGCKNYSVIGSEPITGRFIFKKTAFSNYSSSNQRLLLTGCQLSFGCRLFMLLQLLTLHWWPPYSSWKTTQMVERVHMMMQWAGPSQLQTNNICGQDTFSLHLQQTSKNVDLPNPFERNLLDANFPATCASNSMTLQISLEISCLLRIQVHGHRTRGICSTHRGRSSRHAGWGRNSTNRCSLGQKKIGG